MYSTGLHYNGCNCVFACNIHIYNNIFAIHSFIRPITDLGRGHWHLSVLFFLIAAPWDSNFQMSGFHRLTIHCRPMVYLPAIGYLELPTSSWGSSTPGNRSSHHHRRIASSPCPRRADPRDSPPLPICSPTLGPLSKTTCKSTR